MYFTTIIFDIRIAKNSWSMCYFVLNILWHCFYLLLLLLSKCYHWWLLLLLYQFDNSTFCYKFCEDTEVAPHHNRLVLCFWHCWFVHSFIRLLLLFLPSLFFIIDSDLIVYAVTFSLFFSLIQNPLCFFSFLYLLIRGYRINKFCCDPHRYKFIFIFWQNTILVHCTKTMERHYSSWLDIRQMEFPFVLTFFSD